MIDDGATHDGPAIGSAVRDSRTAGDRTADSTATREVAGRMADAASALLASLDPDQRARVGWPAPDASAESGESGESELERRRWFYTPTDHGGLPVGEMTPSQYRRTMALVASGLSHAGYVTVTTVMGLENVLDRSEGFAGPGFDRDRGRDPGMYYVRVFGTPGERIWGWRFGGHHVSLNNLVVDGEVAATTPCFLGADPATSPLLGAELLRPLGGVEGLARELVRSLSDSQRDAALLAPRAPVDIVAGNRARVGTGPAQVIPLPLLFRDRLDTRMDELMWAAHDGGERHLGLTNADRDALELTPAAKGLPAAELDHGQRELLRAVLGCHSGRVPTVLAERAARRWAGPALDAMHFAWAGSTEAGEPHYYRVQGPRLLVEYDNTQRQVNHAHSVWRDPENDFGADVLAEHLTARWAGTADGAEPRRTGAADRP